MPARVVFIIKHFANGLLFGAAVALAGDSVAAGIRGLAPRCSKSGWSGPCRHRTRLKCRHHRRVAGRDRPNTSQQQGLGHLGQREKCRPGEQNGGKLEMDTAQPP
jgi:hypothetical protein